MYYTITTLYIYYLSTVRFPKTKFSPRPVFFLVQINDFVDNISSDVRLFADDTSLFTVVYDESGAANQLNRDLKTISDWAYQWKM